MMKKLTEKDKNFLIVMLIILCVLITVFFMIPEEKESAEEIQAPEIPAQCSYTYWLREPQSSPNIGENKREPIRYSQNYD